MPQQHCPLYRWDHRLMQIELAEAACGILLWKSSRFPLLPPFLLQQRLPVNFILFVWRDVLHPLQHCWITTHSLKCFKVIIGNLFFDKDTDLMNYICSLGDFCPKCDRFLFIRITPHYLDETAEKMSMLYFVYIVGLVTWKETDTVILIVGLQEQWDSKS